MSNALTTIGRTMLINMIKLFGIQSNISTEEGYDIKEDFDWYTSGEPNTEPFKGQYIAIWKKRIVGSGETPLEAERIAKAHHGNDCRPAVVYIPRDEEVDTFLIK